MSIPWNVHDDGDPPSAAEFDADFLDAYFALPHAKRRTAYAEATDHERDLIDAEHAMSRAAVFAALDASDLAAIGAAAGVAARELAQRAAAERAAA